MVNKAYKWIVNCVDDYFSFINREFESKELGLKLGIYKNMDNDYYIEFRHNDKISILTGGEKLSKGQMIDLLEHTFIKDLRNPKTIDIEAFKKETFGKTILIVGHSNTIPNMVNQIIKENKYSDIAENQFGNLYIVTIFENQILSQLLHLK
jgi:hypothetical protein